MTEFFVYAESFAAPFASDESTHFVQGATATDALTKFAESYRHRAGLYAAALFVDANAFHKGEKPLAIWLSNRARDLKRATEGLSGYSMISTGIDSFEIDGKRYVVRDSRLGSVVIP